MKFKKITKEDYRIVRFSNSGSEGIIWVGQPELTKYINYTRPVTAFMGFYTDCFRDGQSTMSAVYWKKTTVPTDKFLDRSKI